MWIIPQLSGTLLLIDVRPLSPFELLIDAEKTLVYRFLGRVCASISLCYLLRNGMGRLCRHPVSLLGAFKLFSMASEPLTFFSSSLQEFSCCILTNTLILCCDCPLCVLFEPFYSMWRSISWWLRVSLRLLLVPIIYLLQFFPLWGCLYLVFVFDSVKLNKHISNSWSYWLHPTCWGYRCVPG